jgi:predicted phage terminase large subunit-like protein
MAPTQQTISGPDDLDRAELIVQVRRAQANLDEWIRRQVLQNNRVDILAREVLGYDVAPHHFAMMRFQLLHKKTLQLAFRGAGKTTVLTVVRIIYEIIKNPNIRILIASKTLGYAQGILREIKAHLESNEELRRIFGDFVSEEKWDTSEILVKGRTSKAKESTVTCLGLGGQITGPHFDMIFADDLIDENNSRTAYMRNLILVWWGKTLDPTLEPHGELHVVGTRYHYDDIYGHLEKKDMKGRTQVIRALDEQGRSAWPEKYSAEWFAEKRETKGVIIFNSQYQCDTEAMKGEIFQYDWMTEVEPSDVPSEGPVYYGVDLAIKKEDRHDSFAMVGIKVTKDRRIWILDSFKRRLGFSEQTEKIREWWRSGVNGWASRGSLVEAGIENNAYQEAQPQQLEEVDQAINIRRIHTSKDKYTRGIKLAAYFSGDRVRIVKGQSKLIEELVLFKGEPKGIDDLFDALDHAVYCAFHRKRRRQRKEEPGLL